MIEAAGITLRESIEAILVIFIMTAYLERANDVKRNKYVYSGAFIAVGLSILFAFILSAFKIDPENDLMEGIMYWVASILVATLIIWMGRHAKHFKTEIEGKIAKSSGNFALAFIAFVMVFREGAETVIFLQSLLLAGTTPIQNFLGGVIGVTLAIVFGIVFLRGTARINLSRFFKITTAILLVLAFELLIDGFHEFFEAQYLPSTKTLLTIVGLFKRNSTSAAIITLMLLALILTVLYDMLKARQPDLSSLKPAERRKAKYNFLKEKYTKATLASIITLTVVVLLAPIITASDIFVPKPIMLRDSNGVLKVAEPGKDGLYRYQYKEARFLIAVKDNSAHVALDECSVCPPVGYGYDGKALICLNCDTPIPIENVGRPGDGCDPLRAPYTIKNDTVIIHSDSLLSAWSK